MPDEEFCRCYDKRHNECTPEATPWIVYNAPKCLGNEKYCFVDRKTGLPKKIEEK